MSPGDTIGNVYEFANTRATYTLVAIDAYGTWLLRHANGIDTRRVMPQEQGNQWEIIRMGDAKR